MTESDEADKASVPDVGLKAERETALPVMNKDGEASPQLQEMRITEDDRGDLEAKREGSSHHEEDGVQDMSTARLITLAALMTCMTSLAVRNIWNRASSCYASLASADA
jgi:hypothetical protein